MRAATEEQHDWSYDVAVMLHRQEELTEQLVRLLGFLSASNTELAVGASRQIRELDEFLPGVRRIIAGDHSQGVDSLALVSATPTDVVPGTVGRIGGQIVNSGASPVILYLARASDIQTSTAGKAALWLAAGGGSWDFRISQALWCGHVCAVAQGGASSLSVAVI